MAAMNNAGAKAANQFIKERNDFKRRLTQIAQIIEAVDDRCLAADGPVTPTNQEITIDEIRKIYRLAGGKRDKK